LKLKATAKGLQAWSDKRVGHVESQLGLAREILHHLEIAQDGRPLTPAKWTLKSMLKKHCLALASLRQTIAGSRSRIGWLKGDANTKFFQTHVRHRKRKNFITDWFLTVGYAYAFKVTRRGEALDPLPAA
jgi:hypothetical protein